MVTYSQPFDVIRTDIATRAPKNTTVLYEATYPAVAHDGSSADTYLAWQQHSAGLAYDIEVYGVAVTVGNAGAISAGTLLVEVGTGAAAAEVTVAGVGCYIIGGTTAEPTMGTVFELPTPILVAAGTRFATRTKFSTTDAEADFRVVLLWRKVS